MRLRTTVLLAAVFLGSALVCQGADVGELVKQLTSTTKEEDRAAAITELRKLGSKAEEEMKKLETNEKMDLQQLLILRRLIGECLISTTTLKPIDPATVTPFGEDKSKNIAGHPDISINKDTKVIVMNAEFCLENGPLEYLCVSKGKDSKVHESIVAIDAQPRDICTAMLVCNYTYAGELGEDGSINLPKDAGVYISVEFDWEIPRASMKPRADGVAEDKPEPDVKVEKKTVRVPIEFFVWNARTEQPMRRVPFAFTGSRFEKDENGKLIFMADIERSLVAVKVDPFAVLNTPLNTRDIDPNRDAGYAINRHTTPPRKTKCKIIFEPSEGGKLTADMLKDTGEKAGPGTPPSGPGQ